MIWPTIVLETRRPTTIGIVSRPDSVGDLPRAICMYWLRNTEVPNSATPTAMLAITASTSERFSNSRSGIIGSAARRSTSTAGISSPNAPITSAAVCHDAHSIWWPAIEIQISSTEMPADTRNAPA